MAERAAPSGLVASHLESVIVVVFVVVVAVVVAVVVVVVVVGIGATKVTSMRGVGVTGEEVMENVC